MSADFTENPLRLDVDTHEVLIENRDETSVTSPHFSQLLKSRSKSNQQILIFTCTVFFLFVIAEIFGAIMSGSLSLLGDAGAMSVDVFTYLCNIIAERLKAKNAELSLRVQIILELVIPSFSVICLLGVTCYVTVDAINVISDKSGVVVPVKINYLYGFAAANLFIDFLSSYVFLRNDSKEHVFFISTVKEVDDLNISGSDIPNPTLNTEVNSTPKAKKRVNLNMISAFTHLTGDSMRSISVFIAALVSTFSGVQSQICDAWAAVVVTVTIVLMVVPLIREIFRASRKYR